MKNMKAIKFTTNIKNPCLFAEKRWVSARENPKTSKLNTPFDPLIILFSCSIFRYQRKQKYIIKLKKKKKIKNWCIELRRAYTKIELREERLKKPANSFPVLFGLQIRAMMTMIKELFLSFDNACIYHYLLIGLVWLCLPLR